jgi:hypothetical protein
MEFLRQFYFAITSPIRAIISQPYKLFQAPKKIFSLSVPAQVAIFTFLFLIACLAVAVVIELTMPEKASFDAWWASWGKTTILGVLLVVIPLVVYYAVKLWLEGDVSRFPDIDYAWKAGMADLRKNGLDINQIPLFLVLGSQHDKQEESLFNASRMSFRVRNVPPGPSALAWYASPNAIFLVASETCCLSRLAVLAHRLAEEAKQAPSGARVLDDAIPSQPGDVRGTMAIQSGGAPPAGQPSVTSTGPMVPLSEAQGAGDVRGTSMVKGTVMIGSETSFPTMMPPLDKRRLSLGPAEAAEAEQRLEYLCTLIRKARQPLCPINGILTLLPFSIIERSSVDAVTLQQSVDRDLAVVSRTLMIRCMVVALVTGLEQESGFRELVRRMGPEKARSQRFGKGFPLWAKPAPTALEALNDHACGAFEDWVYELFRQKGSLSKPGNTRLYLLLCKVRHNLRNRLTNILRSGYGGAAEQEAPQEDREAFLFGGCYFAATGETEDQQAFVKNVFDRLPEQQEELEWTAGALRQVRKYQSWATFLFIIDFLLAVAIGGILAWKYGPWW